MNDRRLMTDRLTTSPFSIIILTFNEEKNIEACLDSLGGLEAPVFVVDSYSTDRTIEILERRGIRYAQNPFGNYSRQRNWAQANCPFETDWVLHLDAGERCTPEMVDWLKNSFNPGTKIDGFMFSRRTIFFGQWIKRGGHYPNYHLRLFRKNKGRCEEKIYDQHFVAEGELQHLPPGIDIIDTVADSLLDFTRSHARWALFEAIEMLSKKEEKGEVRPRLYGTPIERRRWLKVNVFHKTPLFLRAFLYFNFRYFFRLGFLDGKKGLVFHFLQGFWFRFLVDAFVLELKYKMRNRDQTLMQVIESDFEALYLKLLTN
jgi:glycosyltransferase involved in cell wall biosynthesis